MEEFLEAVKRFQHEDTKQHRVGWNIVLIFLVSFCGCAQRNLQEAKDMLQLNYPPAFGVVPREQWGWEAGERTLPNHTISKITIHHGGEDYPADKDVIEYLRHLQSWSRSEKHWIDIPYHFMIDLKGTLYEARPLNLPGDTNTSYDVNGHALICVMGNYENQIMSQQQLVSLIDLTAFLAKRFSVPVDSIKGHRDYTETLCPGRDLYRYLQDGSIVKSVKDKLSIQ